MPKKFLRRWLPHPTRHSQHRALRWLGPVLEDPNLFHLNRHSVSVAFFVGLFCAFLPLPGQTLIAALLALLLRCNLPISVLLIWVTNPLTMTPIFLLTYELGRWILDSPPVDFHFRLELDWFQEQGESLLMPLLLGSLLTGLLAGGTGYVIIHEIWRWTVIRNWEARKKRRLAQKTRSKRYS
jgi:hypothetical protein